LRSRKKHRMPNAPHAGQHAPLCRPCTVVYVRMFLRRMTYGTRYRFETKIAHRYSTRTPKNRLPENGISFREQLWSFFSCFFFLLLSFMSFMSFIAMISRAAEQNTTEYHFFLMLDDIIKRFLKSFDSPRHVGRKRVLVEFSGPVPPIEGLGVTDRNECMR
jgi:hypothetical protein